MKAYKHIFAAGLVAMSITSCSDDKESFGGEGYMTLNASINTDIVSRASDQQTLETELGESLLVWISSKDGVVREYAGLDNLPTEPIRLLGGTYKAEAWAGDSVPASFTHRWFKGYQDFAITAGENTPVEINCKIQNVKVTAYFDESLAENEITDCVLTVRHERGNIADGYGLEYTEDGEKSGYFMMPSWSKNLNAQFVGKNAAGSVVTGGEIIDNVEPGHEYIVTISANPKEDDTTVGGAFFDIKIIDNGEIVKCDVDVAIAPTIEYQINGSLHPLTETITAKAGALLPPIVWVSGYDALANVTMASDIIERIIGKRDFDVFAMDDDTKSKLDAAGLRVMLLPDEENAQRCGIELNSDFIDAYLYEDKTYVFEISAVDKGGRKHNGTLSIKISSDPVQINDLNNVSGSNTFSTAEGKSSIIVSGSILNTNATAINVEYALAETTSRADEWISVPAVITGNTYSATIKGLSPNKTYEYRVAVDVEGKDTWYSDIMTVTTANGPQLPNAGFEEWQTNSAPYLIYSSGGSMFWDSGNHGSATMSKNVTSSDETIKNSGKYSAKLASQFVGVGALGKFAAGNLFIGEYLATLGTNGVLGWGRTFNGRPTKLKGYVRYEPVAITNVDKNAPAEYVKGEMDKGIIYIALMDDNLYEYDGKKYPVIVNTKTQEFFEKDGKHKDHVIAYGEMVFSEATQGSGMVEFTINLDYRSTDIPSYIVITASASKGGDYFTGGSGSNMWLDDLELIYE